MMKKAMISQPMNGLTTKEIMERRKDAEEYLKDLGYEIVSTVFSDEWVDENINNNPNIQNTPLFYLAKSLELMAQCDTVYFLNGWEKARGCILENATAKSYDMNIMYEGSSGIPPKFE